MKYVILLEEGENNWSAYCPDLPGCISTGQTREDTIKNMIEAIQYHIEGLKEDRLKIPDPKTTAETVTID